MLNPIEAEKELKLAVQFREKTLTPYFLFWTILATRAAGEKRKDT